MMGLFGWITGSSKAKVPSVLQGQMHQLDQIDREHRQLNSQRIRLQDELGRVQDTLSDLASRQAEEANRKPTDWYNQPEYYAARNHVLLSRQLDIKSELADNQSRQGQLRTERMELVEKMNAPAESDSTSAVTQDQPTT